MQFTMAITHLNNVLITSNVSKKPILCCLGSIVNKTLVNIIRNFSVKSDCKEDAVESNKDSQEYFENDSAFLNEQLDSLESGLFRTESQNVESPEDSKILKAAIIGTPNSGKSTLINKIVGRQIFAISAKVHTTRCRARAVHTEGKTQLIFLDTPGLVTGYELNKHNLEKAFLDDGESSIQEADVVGIVHDVSSDRYNDRLDPKVLRLLHFYPDKHTVLIINKIDTLKSKRVLLDLADVLTCNTNQNRKHIKSVKKELQDEWGPKTEFTVNRKVKKQKGWPNFKEVFMVSALEGNGVGDIRQYLLNSANPGNWLFPKYVFTDQTYIKMIEETVQSKLLDLLPNEVPYNLSTQLEYYDRLCEGSIVAVVLIGCNSPRIERLVMGPAGKRIKEIATAAEETLANSFRVQVRLRLVVTKKKERTVNIDDLVESGSLNVLHTYRD